MRPLSGFGRRIRTLRTRLGLTQDDVANALGVTRQAVGQWESERRQPDYDTLARLAQLLNTDPGYILTGVPNVHPTEVQYVPVLGRIHAGQAVPPVEEILEYRPVPADLLKGGQYFFLQVRGDCMDGGPHPIRDGYLVLVRMQPTVESGQVAVVFLPGQDEAVLRRVRLVDGHVLLTADNPAYPPVLLKPDDVRIIGRVVQVIFEPAPVRDV